MNKTDVIKSVVGVLGFLFGLYNVIASRYGWGVIQFDSAALTTAINTIITLAFGAYSTWKNCNITSLSKDMQKLKNAIKNKDIDTLKSAIGTLGEMKDQLEAELDNGESIKETVVSIENNIEETEVFSK